MCLLLCNVSGSKPVIAGLGAVLSLAAPGPVSKAETLKEALTAAYLFDPTLKAARAQLLFRG